MKCDTPRPDCNDKKSTHYFMCHMTQEDWEERRAWSDLKLAEEVEYHYHMMRYMEIKNED